MKVFIRQQISEAIQGLKMDRREKAEDNRNKKFKNGNKVRENTYLKPKNKPIIRDIKKVNIDVDWRRRDSGGESEAAVPRQGIVSWAEVAAKPRPKRSLGKREPVRGSTKSRLANPASRGTNPPKVRVPRLAAVSIHCRDKEKDRKSVV